MKDELIQFETAKLAKEKGFNYTQRYELWKHKDKLIESNGTEPAPSWVEEVIPRPTQSLLQRWFREIHKIFIDVIITTAGNGDNLVQSFEVAVKTIDKKIKFECIMDEFPTYELALEVGLVEALNLI